jgi:hypothetical protein
MNFLEATAWRLWRSNRRQTGSFMGSERALSAESPGSVHGQGEPDCGSGRFPFASRFSAWSGLFVDNLPGISRGSIPFLIISASITSSLIALPWYRNGSYPVSLSE